MKPTKFYNNKKITNPVVKNRREADRLIHSAYRTFMLLGLMALRDEFDFGGKRLGKFVDRMHSLLDSYNQGYISTDDLHDTILAETGIEVKLK